MYMLLNLDYAKFGVLTYFFPKVIGEKPLKAHELKIKSS